MVREYLYLVFGSFAVSSPVLECIHHGQEFFIADFVIYLCWGELPRMEGNWMQTIFLVTL